MIASDVTEFEFWTVTSSPVITVICFSSRSSGYRIAVRRLCNHIIGKFHRSCSGPLVYSHLQNRYPVS